jgi:hypothetical protein
MLFSQQEKINIIFTYGECHRCYRAAARILQARQGNDKFSEMNIKRIVKLFEDTGSVKELPRVRYALPKNINFQNAVVDEVTENPHTSTRAVAATLNVSQSTIIRTLKALKFHPYKMILQQELHGEDFQKRTEFCNFIQRQNGVYSHILFSDEAIFRSDSIVNRHNMALLEH